MGVGAAVWPPAQAAHQSFRDHGMNSRLGRPASLPGHCGQAAPTCPFHPSPPLGLPTASESEGPLSLWGRDGGRSSGPRAEWGARECQHLAAPHRSSTWPTCLSSSPTRRGRTSGCWSGPRTSARPTSHGTSLPVSLPAGAGGGRPPGWAAITRLSQGPRGPGRPPRSPPACVRVWGLSSQRQVHVKQLLSLIRGTAGPGGWWCREGLVPPSAPCRPASWSGSS